MDPLNGDYPSLSPYVFVADNPIMLIDVDGRKIVIAGSAEFRQTTFNDMQKISSSNLIMLKNGQVMEAAHYKETDGEIAITGQGTGKKDFGTQIIQDLASNMKYTVTIKQDKTKTENNEYSPENNNYKDAQDPTKGVGGTITYDPESRGRRIVNVGGGRGTSAFILLAHELIHSWKAMKGKMLSIVKNGKLDPDNLPNNPVQLSKEEIDTRGKENIIRKENNKTERATP